MIIKDITTMATITYEKLTNNNGVNMMYILVILMEHGVL